MADCSSILNTSASLCFVGVNARKIHRYVMEFIYMKLHFIVQLEKQLQWFSGKIQRCHRWAPRSIRGWSTLFLLLAESPLSYMNAEYGQKRLLFEQIIYFIILILPGI